jgi:hypothetical protein
MSYSISPNDVTSNWWGDPSGPYNPATNPNGLGDEVGNNLIFDPWLTQVVGVVPQPSTHPSTFQLFPPRPNPFNPTTAIMYELRVPSHVSLKVYDTAGRLVVTLVESMQGVGAHQITFDGSSLPSGLYLYRLIAGQNTATGKMVLLK